MKSVFSGERAATCGQMMLSVRRVLDLTRAELARQLGVSAQTMRSWETGKRAPKPEHLKQFIELALRGQVFPVGQRRRRCAGCGRKRSRRCRWMKHGSRPC